MKTFILQKQRKHSAIRYYYIQYLIKQRVISLEYQSIKEMIADGLTKLLSLTAFKWFVKSFGLTTVAMVIESQSKDTCEQ